MAITKDQVFAAADRLFNEGTAPTLIAIRKELGSGSFSTISGMLAEWKSASRKGDVADVELPEELEDALASAGGRIWAFALKLAQDDAQLTKDESRELVQLAESARDEALQLATDLQVENDALIDKLMKAEAMAERTNGNLQEIRGSWLAVQGEVEVLKKVNRELLQRLPKVRAPAKPTPAAPLNKGAASAAAKVIMPNPDKAK